MEVCILGVLTVNLLLSERPSPIRKCALSRYLLKMAG